MLPAILDILTLEDLKDEQAYQQACQLAYWESHKEEVAARKNQWKRVQLCQRTANSLVEEVPL